MKERRRDARTDIPNRPRRVTRRRRIAAAPQAEQNQELAWTSENLLPEGVTMTSTGDGAELTFSFDK